MVKICSMYCFCSSQSICQCFHPTYNFHTFLHRIALKMQWWNVWKCVKFETTLCELLVKTLLNRSLCVPVERFHFLPSRHFRKSLLRQLSPEHVSPLEEFLYIPVLMRWSRTGMSSIISMVNFFFFDLMLSKESALQII